jgi:magnesium chelatase family protein
MILKSFVRSHFGLKPIEVEVVLTPGLPTISILGLPDKSIQESTKRIQAALLNQGFQIPKARQVLVNLWPREMKKSSLGLDLAIALGILHESGQKIFNDTQKYIYGELDMLGQVRAPQDLIMLDVEEEVLTGATLDSFTFDLHILKELKSEPSLKKADLQKKKTQRPPFLFANYAPAAAELMQITCAGEHSLVLVGPPGSGKTSFVDGAKCFINEPSSSQLREIQKNNFYYKQLNFWRPVIKPHHSSTALSFVGGGAGLEPGEIVRAQNGILILDELLEFSTEVQSILREPMEDGVLRLARVGKRQEFQCRTLILATSNLCPCGEYTPTHFKGCRCSSLQLRRYLQKLSGPFVDRFSMLAYTNNWAKNNAQTVPSEEILENISKANHFRQQERGQNVPNCFLSETEIRETFFDESLEKIIPQFQSKRRLLALLRVARTIADLAEEKFIKKEHVEKSLFYVHFPFEEIKKVF